MEYLNDLERDKLVLDRDLCEKFLVAISVMVPHFASELLETLLDKTLEHVQWPVYDPALAVEHEVTVVVQINGKLRASLVVAKGAGQDLIEPQAREAVRQWLADKTIIKTVFVADRLVNFVVKG
jgi:leucyl-tRNA synthetase